MENIKVNSMNIHISENYKNNNSEGCDGREREEKQQKQGHRTMACICGFSNIGASEIENVYIAAAAACMYRRAIESNQFETSTHINIHNWMYTHIINCIADDFMWKIFHKPS